MERIKFIFMTMSFLLATTTIQASSLGFDEVCSIYTEAKNSSLSKDQLAQYINNNVAKRVDNKDAVTAHSLLPQVNPPDRYEIFKESAEYSLKREWNCAAAKDIMK